jgi:hypothetical protein
MSDKIKITINEQPRELFMSFGLLNEISRDVGDVENVAMVGIDPELREKILQTLLAERDDDGKVTKKFNFFKADLSMDDINRVIEWVSENLLDFFLKALAGANSLREKNEPKLQSLMSSLAGSQASSSKTPVAGPSTPSPAS